MSHGGRAASCSEDGGHSLYEVRRYPAWYRFVTLALLAHAFLAVTRATITMPGVTMPGKGGVVVACVPGRACR